MGRQRFRQSRRAVNLQWRHPETLASLYVNTSRRPPLALGAAAAAAAGRAQPPAAPHSSAARAMFRFQRTMSQKFACTAPS